MRLLLMILVMSTAAAGGNHHDDDTVALNRHQRHRLRSVVKNMIGFDEDTLPPSHDNLSGTKTAGVDHEVPSYMRRLYEQYKTGLTVHDSDTVRSISSQLAVVANSSLFVFNLSSIEAAEHVIAGRIHVLKRRTNQHHRTAKRRVAVSMTSSNARRSTAAAAGDDVTDIELSVMELAPSFVRPLTSFTMSRSERPGWHSHDVTHQVRQLMMKMRSNHQHLMAISFTRKVANSTVGLPLSNYYLHFNQLVLLLFTKHRDHQQQQQQQQHFESRDTLSQHLHHQLNDDDIVSGTRSTSSRQRDDEASRADRKYNPDGRVRDLSSKSKEKNRTGRQRNIAPSRTRRNVDDNDITDIEINEQEPSADADDVETDDGYNIPPRRPSASGQIRQLNISRRQRNHSVAPTTPVEVMTTSSTPSTLTTPGRRKTRPRESRRQRQGAGRGSDVPDQRLLPDPSEYVDSGTTFWNEEVDDGVCKRRRLMVDFADIGWADWIISPTFFDAYYCDGECRFPISKKLRPTNHANIQSIVHAVGIHSTVPSACCVPASLSSVTLLYFDQNHNVMLRNYPDMSVKSCACR